MHKYDKKGRDKDASYRNTKHTKRNILLDWFKKFQRIKKNLRLGVKLSVSNQRTWKHIVLTVT